MKTHYGMGESPFHAFRGRRANLPEDLVFPEIGDLAEEEATQVQETLGRFEVFYGWMQGCENPTLVDYKWGINELVWFHTPLRIYQGMANLYRLLGWPSGPTEL